MSISYQVLILHDSGNTGPGDVIANGYTDLTKDGKYDAAKCSVRTDFPEDGSCQDYAGDITESQFHRYTGSGYELANKDYDTSMGAPVWDGTTESYIPRNQVVKSMRDDMVNNDLANWGTLSTDRKKELVRCFVWPASATTTELDALYPQSERESFMCDVVSRVVIDTSYIKSNVGDLTYWKQVADAAGVMSTEELKSDEVW